MVVRVWWSRRVGLDVDGWAVCGCEATARIIGGTVPDREGRKAEKTQYRRLGLSFHHFPLLTNSGLVYCTVRIPSKHKSNALKSRVFLA